jgi:hypothetical protein
MIKSRAAQMIVPQRKDLVLWHCKGGDAEED